MSKFDISKNIITIENNEYEWEWYDWYWKKYDVKTQKKLEDLYKKKPNGQVLVSVSGQNYRVDLATMKQVNIGSSYSRNVRRNLKTKNEVKVNIGELKKIFNKYHVVEVDSDEDSDEEDEELDDYGNKLEGLNANQIIKLCSDLKIDPMKDIGLTILFYKLNCSKKFFISKYEFIVGFAKLKIENFNQMKREIPNVKKQILSTPKLFRHFYNWVFDYMKKRDQKRLEKELAIETWKLVLKNKFHLLDKWCKFIQEEYPHSISKDTWSQLLLFSNDERFKNEEGIKEYDSSVSSYPIAIDNFIEHLQNKNKSE